MLKGYRFFVCEQKDFIIDVISLGNEMSLYELVYLFSNLDNDCIEFFVRKVFHSKEKVFIHSIQMEFPNELDALRILGYGYVAEEYIK